MSTVIWKITSNNITTTYSFLVERAAGAGYPDPDNIITRYGLADGALFNRQVFHERNFGVVGWLQADSVSEYHSFRQLLISAIRRTTTTTPLTISYEVDGKVVQIQAYYAGGLDSSGDLCGFNEKMTLRFLAVDPFWKATTTESATLPASASTAINRYIRTTGSYLWETTGTGASGTVYAATEDATYIYLGGSFATFNGSTVNNVVRITKASGTVTPMGTGATKGVDDTVYALALDSTGKLYIGGKFANAGGAAATQICSYDPATNAFSTMGGGVTSKYAGDTFAVVYCIAVDTSDNVFVGGVFIGLNSVTCNRIGYWNGSTFVAMGSGGNVGLSPFDNNACARAIAIDNSNGVVYVGGEFDGIAGTSISADHVGKWTVATNTWSTLTGISLGGGPTHTVYSLAIPLPGTLYIGGQFTLNNGLAVNKLLYWDGTTATDKNVGTGTEKVYALAWDSTNSRLYLGGNFSTAGGDADKEIVIYLDSNGDFQDLDIDLKSIAGTVYAINRLSNSILFGFSGTGTMNLPDTTTATSTGTAPSYPTITIEGPGAVSLIKNSTTGEKIGFITGLLTLATGEILTIDLTPGNRRVYSNIVESYRYALSDDTSLANFHLDEGANTIVVSIASTTVSRTMTWYPSHWSFDAVAVI